MPGAVRILLDHHFEEWERAVKREFSGGVVNGNAL